MVELTIPNEWLKVSISDLADVDLGKTPKKTNYLSAGDYKVVKFRDVDYSGIDWSIDKDGFVHNKTIGDLRELKRHDVLITASAHSSEHIGRKICFVTKLPKDYKRIYFCGELLGIRSKDDLLSPKFCFYYFLSHAGYKEIQSHVKGVHLTSGQARNMSIPFTPPPEQNRIIEIVEELFSDLDNAIENLKKAQEQLKVYKQAILQSAFEGDSVPFNEVVEKPLGQIGKVKGGKRLPKGQKVQDEETKYPYIRVVDFRDFSVDLVSLKYITEGAQKKIVHYIIQKDEVFISIAGTIGRVGMIPECLDGANLTENAAKITEIQEVIPRYLMYYLASPRVQHEISFLKKATSQPKLALYRIEKIAVKYPKNVAVQCQAIQEIESRLSVCDKIQETIGINIQNAEALRQSILKQAFEGKLTEQWRKEHKDLICGENSAEALLEKIKVEKSHLEAGKKRKKRGA